LAILRVYISLLIPDLLCRRGIFAVILCYVVFSESVFVFISIEQLSIQTIGVLKEILFLI
jgi:hypothetical protein